MLSYINYNSNSFFLTKTNENVKDNCVNQMKQEVRRRKSLIKVRLLASLKIHKTTVVSLKLLDGSKAFYETFLFR